MSREERRRRQRQDIAKRMAAGEDVRQVLLSPEEGEQRDGGVGA